MSIIIKDPTHFVTDVSLSINAFLIAFADTFYCCAICK